MWSPFSSQGFNIFPQQALGQQTSFASNARSHDSWKIDLPGGGFIEKPGSEACSTHNLPSSRSAQSSEFKTPDERKSLLDRLDILLDERAARERALQDLFAQETSLQKSLNEVNAALDTQDKELSQLTESVRIKKEDMLNRIETKKLRIANLQETLRELHREETRTASYRIRAAEGRALRKQISQGCKERKVLQDNVDELDRKAELLVLRCKTIDSEEKTVLKNISEEMQRLAEDGFLMDFPKQCCRPEDSNEIMVEAEFHQELRKKRPPLQSVRRMIKHCDNNPAAQRTESSQYLQLAEQIEVPGDNGAKNGNTKKRGFISSVKRLFTRRFKPGSAYKKQSKKEHEKVMYNSKLSGTVTMVTLSQATNLHKATDALDGEPSVQENHQISVET